MDYIRFIVEGQKLDYSQKYYSSTDTIDTLYCNFKFVEDDLGHILGGWDLPYLWAQFHDEQGNVYVKEVTADNTCSIPYDCLRQRKFKMTLFATDTEDYMTCKKRYTTNEITFRFNGLANINYDGGGSPDEPMPTNWQILLDRVDTCESSVDGLSQNVATMGDKVDGIDSRVTSNTNAIDELSQNVTSMHGTLDNLSAELDDEKTARENADANLQSAINDRYTKAETDTLINAESTARANADADLQAAIQAEETKRREDIEGVNSTIDGLSTSLDTESTARANADTRLERLISDESVARANADAAMQLAIQAEEKTRSEKDIDESIALKMVINSVANIEFNRKDESHTVTLTNTASYPFNNSLKTIALDNTRSTNNYIVDANVISADGLPGEIVVFDKLINGFKVEYEGSAKSVTVKLNIAGGM